MSLQVRMPAETHQFAYLQLLSVPHWRIHVELHERGCMSTLGLD